MKQRKRSRFDWVGLAAGVMLISTALVLFLPLLYVLATSLQPPEVANSPEPAWIFQPTLGNYETLLVKQNFLPYFQNSLVSSLGASLISIIVAAPAAYALSRKTFTGFWGIVTSILAMRALPAVAVAIPFYVIYSTLGLLDTVLSLVLVYLPFNVAVAVWLLRGYFEAVPISLDEAAMVDGCSPVRTLFSIILPVVAPGLAGTFIVTFLFGWNNFLFPLVFTSSQARTVPLALTQYIGEYVISWGPIMAGVVLLSAPLVLISFALRKYMISGLSAGAVKD